LQHIAEHVGVSKYAVSRSLSGKDGVSERTRKTVERAAVELGYIGPVHMHSARSIQLVLHDHDPVNSEVQLRIQRGIQREANRAGHPIQMQWAHEANRLSEIIRTSAGMGMILVGPHPAIDPDTVRGPLPPIVKVASVDLLEPVDQVSSASNEATAALGVRLVQRGHRNIAYLQGNGGLRGRTERYHAMVAAIGSHPGVTLDELHFKEDGGFLSAFEDLRARGRKPTVLVAGNDWIAVSIISDLLRIGLRVPEDISVVGYGDYAAATQITPQLTTIRVPGEEMGIAALQMLMENMHRPRQQSNAYKRLLICPQIIERQSLRPV
jgi:LacI family transcriptional regulator